LSIFKKFRQKTTHKLHKKAHRFGWYKRWHEFRYHHHVHWAILALYVFLLVFFFVFQPANKTLAALNQVTNTVSTQADFEAGSVSGAEIKNVSGGEVQLQGGAGDWLDPAWLYRTPITITENSGSQLDEYQVLITLTPSNFDYSKCQSDGRDIRFGDTSRNNLSYYLEDWNYNGTSTIWVKVNAIAASTDTTIYVYYNNASATAASSIVDTFSYSQPRIVGYVGSQTTAGANLNIISLADGNTISDGTSQLNLDDQGTGTFSSSELSLATPLSATKLFHADGTVNGTDMITPISWASTEFIQRIDRYTNSFDVVSPFGTANVSFYKNGSLIETIQVGPSGTRAAEEIPNDGVVRITSDIPILVQHYGNPGDTRAFYRATTEQLYGVPSTTFEIGAGPSGANTSWVTSSGGSGSSSLGANGNYVAGGQGSFGSAPAFRVTTNNLIGADQLADADGGESTIFLPKSQMGTVFGSASKAGYIAVAAPEPSTTCTVYDSSGQQAGQQTGGTRTDVNKIGFGTGSTSTWISGGWKMICDKPVYAYFEKDIADSDETNLMSYKQMRQYTYPEPTVSSYGTEEGSLSPTGTWTSSSTVGSGILDFYWNGGWGAPNGFEADVNIVANTSITFEVRSSAIGGADSNWSTWQSLGTIDESGGTGDRTFSVAQSSMPSSGNLPVGTNRYIQIRATLSSSDGISNPTLKELRTVYMADQNAPTNPTTVNVWQDNTKTAGEEVTDTNWSNSQTPYFEWSDASDGAGESGIEGYWVYFGTDPTADPKTAGAWQTTANYTGSIDLVDSGKTMYLAISTEDYAENRYTNGTPDYYKKFTYKFDKTAPDEPLYVSVNPVGWSVTDSFDFTWPAASDVISNGDASGIAGYQYKRETDATWSALTTDEFVNGVLSYQNGQNAFYVRSVDTAGNISADNRLAYYYYNADAPSAPQSLSVLPQLSQENSFTFSWDLPATYNSAIKGYYYSVNVLPNENNTSYTTNTSTGEISAATQQGFNTFYVVAMDSSDNISWGNYAEVQFNCQTPAPGIPVNVEVFDTSNRDLQSYKTTINWQEPADKGVGFQGYLIERSEDATSFTQVGSSGGTSYVDTSLQSKLYYYRIIAKDNSGNTSAPSTIVSVTPTGRYTSPPDIITGPDIEVKVSTADISWVTDREASSFVEIGESVGYGLTQGQFEFVVDHKVKIERLKPDTIYHYRVKYVDEDGNIGYSADAILKTLPAPTIANARVEDIRLSTAVVSWETSAEAKSSIYFGKSAGYGMLMDNVSGGFTTNHSVRLTDLDHSSTYHYKIVIEDIDGNKTEGEDHIFETQKFPVISVVRLEPINDRATATMKFTWETNVPTNSVVDYTPSGGVTQQAVDIKLKTKHEIVILGLIDNTFYTIKIRSRDQFGNEAVSDTQTFKTDYDTRPPKVYEVTEETSLTGFGIEAKGQAIISWQTDEPGTSRVEYGLGVIGENYSLSTQEDSALTTSHIVVVPNLKPSSSYYFRATSKDASGNEGKSEEGSLLIEQSKSSVLELIFKSLNSSLGWLFR